LKRDQIKLSLASFFLPVALALIVFAVTDIYPFGERTFMRVDMALQYSSFLSYLSSILHGKNDLFYSFSMNGGSNFFFLNAYYLTNPINYLMTFFSRQQLPYALSWLILLRFGLCGLTSGWYFRSLGKIQWRSLIFSTSYAFIAYTMINAENYFFVDGVIFLPLVLLGIERLMRNHSILTYVLTLAATLITQFYMGFMICIFAVIYFLFRWFLENQGGITYAGLKKVGEFITASLLGGMISALVLIPVAKALSGSPKFSDPGLLKLELNFPLIDLLSKNVWGAYNSHEFKVGLPAIYSGTLVTLLTILFFFNRRISVREKLLSAGVLLILIASFQVSGLNYFWHGLAEPAWWPYRYSFIFSFWLIRLAWRCAEEFSGITKQHLAIAVLLGACSLLFVFLKGFHYLDSVKIGSEFALFLALSALILYLIQHQDLPVKKPILLLIPILAFFSLGLNSWAILDSNTAESLPIAPYQEHVSKVESLLNQISEADQGIFRIENQDKRNYNDPMMFNYAGLSHYSSTANMQELKLLSRIGLQQLWYWTDYHRSLPVASESLMGVKYLLGAEEKTGKPYPRDFTAGNYYASQNPYALPLSFLVPQKIIRPIEFQDDIFIYLNRIFRSLSNSEFGDIFSPVPAIKKDNADGSTVWTLEAETNDAIYMYRFDALNQADIYQLNGKPLPAIEEEFHHGPYRFGSLSEGDQLKITVLPGEDVPADVQRDFYSEDLSVLQKYVSAIQEQAVPLEMVSSSHLRGSYTAVNEGDYLFFSIPFSEGWQVTIDDASQIAIPGPNDLLAVRTIPGTHQFSLRFTPPGFSTGVRLSLAGLIVLAALCLLKKKSAGKQSAE